MAWQPPMLIGFTCQCSAVCTRESVITSIITFIGCPPSQNLVGGFSKYAKTWVCIYACVFACVYVYMYLYMYKCVYAHIHTPAYQGSFYTTVRGIQVDKNSQSSAKVDHSTFRWGGGCSSISAQHPPPRQGRAARPVSPLCATDLATVLLTLWKWTRTTPP